jgi:hypothetical protein
MAGYKVKQGNIFGRIGTGIGKGLGEQIPKEIERSRLSSGLKELGAKKDLTPFEQFSELSSIPGITPQMVQSGAELLKQQQLRDAYKRGRAPGQEFQDQNPQASPNLQSVQFGQLPGQMQKTNPMDQKSSQQTIPSNQDRQTEALSNPPAASENPLNEKYVPASPWNQARNEQAINEAFDRGLATTFPEAQAYANNQRDIYERAPEEYRKQLDYKKGIDQEVDNLFDKQLQTRLQKEGKETFADIPGDLQLNLKKKARNAVATGKMTPEQSAEFFTKKGLDLAKNKSQALKIANRDVLDRLIPHKKEETLKNLMHIAKNYSDMGSDEDFYNFLTTDKIDEKTGRQAGLGLSPGGAAIIQYPRTEKVKSLIKNTKISPKNSAQSTRAFADNLSKDITPQDSFLAIARQMKQQDPNFDEYAFFDYLRENKDQYGTIPRLDLEVTNGVSDFFPNWRDIGLFPAFGKAVTND